MTPEIDVTFGQKLGRRGPSDDNDKPKFVGMGLR